MLYFEMFIVFVLLLAVYVLKAYLRLQNLFKLTSQIAGPCPSKIPFVGNVLAFYGLPHHEILPMFTKWRAQHGALFKVQMVNRIFIILSDPEDIHKILSSNKCLDKSDDYDILKPWLGEGLLTSKGEKWHQRRKLLGSFFSNYKFLENVSLPKLEKNANSFLKDLENLEDAEFEIGEYFSKWCFRNICETGMNTKLDADNDCDKNYLNAAHRLTEIVYKSILEPYIRIVKFPIISKFFKIWRDEEECLRVLRAFTNNVIQTRKTELLNKSSDQKSKSFLDFLFGLSSLKDPDLMEETQTFLFGGHDTISALLSWSVFLLSSNLQAQHRLQEELDSIETPLTTLKDYDRLKYLDCCLKESLRLFPSVPAFNRKLGQDFLLDNGIMLPKGVTLSINIFFLHRDPTLWSNPLEFLPHRFLEEECGLSGPGSPTFLPFSFGPRSCVGKKFAFLETKVMLAKLFGKYEFNLASDPSKPVKLLWDLTLKPQQGVYVRIKRRQSNKYSQN